MITIIALFDGDHWATLARLVCPLVYKACQVELQALFLSGCKVLEQFKGLVKKSFSRILQRPCRAKSHLDAVWAQGRGIISISISTAG